MHSTITDPSYTVDEFCTAEKLSRSQLYEDWRNGTGPDFFWNGKHRRISHEARTRWRRPYSALVECFQSKSQSSQSTKGTFHRTGLVSAAWTLGGTILSRLWSWCGTAMSIASTWLGRIG